MRIIGGKDYYDGAAAYGIDPGIVFVRKGRALTNDDLSAIGNWSGADVTLTANVDPPLNARQDWRAEFATTGATYWNHNRVINGIEYDLESLAVVFCGSLYSGIKISYGKPPISSREVVYFWGADKLRRWAADRNLVANAGGRFAGNRKPLEDAFWSGPLNEHYKAMLIERGITIARKVRQANGGTYRAKSEYAARDSGWEADGDGLKDIGFQAAVDPVTAFQEIAQWVGGALASRGPNIVEITDDKVKIAKHGFDKRSFRKDKQEE